MHAGCAMQDLQIVNALTQRVLKQSFDAILNEASTNASTWGLPRQFLNKRAKKTKVHFDQISEGIILSDPKKRFCVTVFLSMMDILSCQLINHFKGIKSVVTLYQVLEPSFLSNASHLDLEVEARKFSNKFSDNVSPLFPSQMLSIKTLFREKIAHLKSAKEMASFLLLKVHHLPQLILTFVRYTLCI